MRKTHYLFFLLSSISCLVFTESWEDIFKKYEYILMDKAYDVIKKQYASFIDHSCPSISSYVITAIPIAGSDEALIDLRVTAHKRIVMLSDPCVPFDSPCCNSGLFNASRMRLGLFDRLTLMINYLA